jgi:hypothetical protein
MKVVVAIDNSTLMPCERASAEPSPMVEPDSTLPWRWIAPVRANIASRSVVFPLWKGPTNAMHRGPIGLAPLGLLPLLLATAIDASLRRRPADHVRPHFLTPDLHRLSGMWRWQGAVDDTAVPFSICGAIVRRSGIRFTRLHYLR